MLDYVALILDRDVRDIANIDQLDRMPRLLNILAAHAGQLVNHSSYGAALGLTSPTAQKYTGILERLFLLRQIPPWSSNAVSRLTKTPKLHFLDTGLLAALRSASADQLKKDISPAVWEVTLGNPKGSAWFQYSSPALFSMTIGFVSIWLFSILDKSEQAHKERAAFPAQQVRSETGYGAAAASDH